MILRILTAGALVAGIAFGRPVEARAVPVPASAIVHVGNLLEWQLTETREIPVTTVRRVDYSLAPGASKVIAHGQTGQRSVLVSFLQEPSGDIHAKVLSSHVVLKMRPRIVVEGASRYDALTNFAEHGVEKTAYIVSSAMRMIATAYTADCSGCSGITATGRPAGHGVVAVDPHVIPLGTKLYIPGYGVAVAGDTGGAIHGNRIDLGFNSWRDAMLFGRREVTIYTLK
jgi:3D (Asp-Asp-Asp) domain-containing protein